MKVYKWNVPTTNYPVFPNAKSKTYKYIYALLIILIVFILLYYNGTSII